MNEGRNSVLKMEADTPALLLIEEQVLDAAFSYLAKGTCYDCLPILGRKKLKCQVMSGAETA